MNCCFCSCSSSGSSRLSSIINSYDGSNSGTSSTSSASSATRTILVSTSSCSSSSKRRRSGSCYAVAPWLLSNKQKPAAVPKPPATLDENQSFSGFLACRVQGLGALGLQEDFNFIPMNPDWGLAVAV